MGACMCVSAYFSLKTLLICCYSLRCGSAVETAHTYCLHGLLEPEYCLIQFKWTNLLTELDYKKLQAHAGNRRQDRGNWAGERRIRITDSNPFCVALCQLELTQYLHSSHTEVLPRHISPCLIDAPLAYLSFCKACTNTVVCFQCSTLPQIQSWIYWGDSSSLTNAAPNP